MAVAEAPLGEDGRDGVDGAQIDLDELGGLGVDEGAGTPGAARKVHVEPARVGAHAARLVARARAQLIWRDPSVLEPERSAAVVCREINGRLLRGVTFPHYRPNQRYSGHSSAVLKVSFGQTAATEFGRNLNAE